MKEIKVDMESTETKDEDIKEGQEYSIDHEKFQIQIDSFNEEFTEEEIFFIKIYSKKTNSYSIRENIKLFNKSNKDIQNIQKN